MCIASLLESSAQSERLASLSSQLESERTSFSNSLKLLKLEVTDGCDRVVELEEALSSCQKELLGHVTIMEESSCQYESKIKQLQEQVLQKNVVYIYIGSLCVCVCVLCIVHYASVHDAPYAYGSSFVCRFVGLSDLAYLHER